MTLILWILVFVISLAVLIKAAGYFTTGAEIAGLKLKINPFIIGVTIVSIGTSLPELVTSFIAIANGQAAIVAANAIGSNIANILLIVGLTVTYAGILTVRRSLIDLDAPLLAISTAVLVAVVWDANVTFYEAIILILTYIIYISYTVKTGQTLGDEVEHGDRKIKKVIKQDIRKDTKRAEAMSVYRMFLLLIGGVVGVYFGADWVIKSVTEIGGILGIASSVIAITAIAIGTSLPELVVSLQAARQKNYEIALGNVFGSNIFNSLMVVGLPGMFSDLPLDETTYTVGLFFMVTATILYILSGISQKIHRWEGLMYLMLYVLFVGKIFVGHL